MNRKHLLQKIRKCLALAGSANEHEAAAALAKARDLMDAAGVSEDELAHLEVEEQIARGRRTQTPAQWEALLVRTVQRAIGVHAHGDGHGDWLFVGTGPAAEIAAYAFYVLRRQLERARAEYLRAKLRRCTLARKRVRADLFCEGWAAAVYRKIAALRPAGDLPAVIGSYLATHHPGLKTVGTRTSDMKRSSDFDDYARGLERGQVIDLHGGIGRNRQSTALLPC